MVLACAKPAGKYEQINSDARLQGHTQNTEGHKNSLQRVLLILTGRYSIQYQSYFSIIFTQKLLVVSTLYLFMQINK